MSRAQRRRPPAPPAPPELVLDAYRREAAKGTCPATAAYRVLCAWRDDVRQHETAHGVALDSSGTDAALHAVAGQVDRETEAANRDPRTYIGPMTFLAPGESRPLPGGGWTSRSA